MRLIHTADWHLGHTLHGISREYEHQHFLDWLLAILQEQQADALLIAGDVFDSANPPAFAQAMFYRFIAAARQRCPALNIIIVGGNHDSPARLEAPQPLLASLGVQVIGALPRDAKHRPDLERLLVPLRNHRGDIAAWCAAVPFLRPVDLPARFEAGCDLLIEGVRRIYRQALAILNGRLEPAQALIATGHCYMTGARLSELSERKILGGNQHALPADIFCDKISYAALGHLHLAQAISNTEHIRYSGSPIPLSLTEDNYPHQVVQVDFHNRQCQNITALNVPRSVAILRLPEGGPRPLSVVVELLKRLNAPALPQQRQPFIEVSVLLERPEPELRRRIEEALEGKAVRLLKISTHYPGVDGALAECVREVQLQELTPDEVFSRRYQQRHASAPPAELLAAFHELWEAVQET